MKGNKSICCIYSTKSLTYTTIKQNDVVNNGYSYLNNLILFDINSPIIIEVFGNYKMLVAILTKFNKKAYLNLKHIDLKEKLDIDGIYRVMKDFVYINHNALHLKKVENKQIVIVKENIKLFYFKNMMICFKENLDTSNINN